MASSRTTPRVYIDACYYIDVARGKSAKPLDAGRDLHLPYVEKLLLAAQAGDIEIWASTLIITECLATEKNEGAIPQATRDMFVSLLTSGSAVKLQAVDLFIAERARDLRWVHDINCGRSADTVHVATALELGCEEFISADRRRGPLNADAAAKLGRLGLRVVEAHHTGVLPPHYLTPLLDEAGA